MNRYNKTKCIQLMILSQGMALFGSGLVFPFYLLFMRDVGSSFSEFGIAYGLFTVSAALLHWIFGKNMDKYGSKGYLIISSWGTSFVFLVFPIISGIWQMYIIQILLGIFGAMQKTSEKALIANITVAGERGRQIGSYHAWISLFSGFAVIFGGFIVDFFSIDIIFYVGSLFMFISGCFIIRLDDSIEPTNNQNI